MFRFCFVFSENKTIHAALNYQKLKQKKPVKCCIGCSRDLYLLLQINKANTIMIEFLTVSGFAFQWLESKFIKTS